MKILTFDSFNFAGSAQVPNASQFVAFGIAPSSEVDTCLIGGALLGPLSLVPAHAELKAVRAPRTPLADYPRDSQIGQSLALVGYERCDQLIPPQARAMSRANSYGTGGQTADAAVRQLRLPFSGRRHAMFSVLRTGETDDMNIVIRGVRYLSRDLYAKDATLQPFVSEELDTLWGGALSQPFSTVEPTTKIARTIYVGGYDNAEAFDELELWVWGSFETGGRAYCVAEAFGERVL